MNVGYWYSGTKNTFWIHRNNLLCSCSLTGAGTVYRAVILDLLVLEVGISGIQLNIKNEAFRNSMG